MKDFVPLNRSKTGALSITNNVMLKITSFCLCLFFIWKLGKISI